MIVFVATDGIYETHNEGWHRCQIFKSDNSKYMIIAYYFTQQLSQCLLEKLSIVDNVNQITISNNNSRINIG